MSTQPLSSSTTVNRDAAREDFPSALSSTKSWTHAAKVCRASSSASTSHRTASSTPSYPTVTSRRSANRARPGGSPRSRSQILAPDRSSCEHRLSSFRNSTTSSPTTSTQMVSSDEHSSAISTAEDTVERSVASSLTISVGRRAAICTPSNR
jgi:hypothetical protein